MDAVAALYVLLLAAVPFFEARYTIPAAIISGYSPQEAFLLGITGNMLPVVPLLLLLDPVSTWLSGRMTLFRRFFEWLFARTRKQNDRIERWGAIALFSFVAVPLPMTGAWSGCAAAFVFGIRFRYAFPAIALGTIVAALITTLAALGVLGYLGYRT
ncbi:MAG: small multi-drug export protein [Methanomicrobiales archaeon]|nr:small multi-drug export protein [Methanomicrobiales archaeon]